MFGVVQDENYAETMNFFRQWDQLTTNEHVQIYSQLFERYRTAILQDTSNQWLNDPSVTLDIAAVKLKIGAFYISALELSSKAITETRNQGEVATNARPEIKLPDQIVLYLNRVFATIYGYADDFSMIKRRIITTELLLGYRREDHPDEPNMLKPAFNALDQMFFKGIANNPNIPKPFVDTMNTFREALQQDGEEDMMAHVSNSFEKSMGTESGQKTLEFARNATKNDPMMSMLLNTLTAGGGADATMERLMALSGNPDIINHFSDKISSAFSSMGPMGSEPTAESQAASASQGEDVPVVG